MSTHDLPVLNAFLNGLCTLLISAGFVFIKRGFKRAHRFCMLAAAGVSGLFLVSYVLHKILVQGVHTPFGGTGLIRTIYQTMLLSHVVLAMVIVYLVPRTFLLALTGQYERHRVWARWTFPLWYYVSITGVLVYCSLYQWWPVAR